MPRKRLNQNDFLPFHVTGRVNNRERFPLPLEQVWRVFETQALFQCVVNSVEIHALVLMPNHFHLLLTVPMGNLSQVMQVWMREISRTINLKSGRTGHVFGGPHHWSMVGSGAYYRHVLKYVYRNPVRGGLCEQVEDWPFSTLQGLLGISRLGFPMHYPRSGHGLGIIAPEAADQLPWLNRPFRRELQEKIQAGLRYREFRIGLDRTTRKPMDVEDDALALPSGTDSRGYAE